MKYKTYDRWNELGYYILPGEKHRKRNKNNECVFGEDQVKEKKYTMIIVSIMEWGMRRMNGGE